MARVNEKFAWDDCMASRWFVLEVSPKSISTFLIGLARVDDALNDTMYNIPRTFLCMRDYEHDE